MKWHAVSAALLLLLLAAASGSWAWKMGAGHRDASPTTAEIKSNKIFLGGYGILGWRGSTFGYARGVNDEMGVHSFYLESEADGSGFVSAVLDTVGLGNRLVDQIRREAGKRTGLSISRIMVSATHTHAGPDLQGLWAGVSPSYRKRVVDLAVEAIVDAVKTAEPVTLYASSVIPGEGLTNNRRGWGFTLNTTTLLQGRSRQDDRRVVANVLNFAAHPTTLGASNLLMSADYPYWARKALTRMTGGPTVFVNGPIGDVTARSEGSNFERPEFFGEKVASVAFSTVSRQVEVQDRLQVRTVSWFQPVTNPIFKLAFCTGLLNNYYQTVKRDGKLGVTSDVLVFMLGRQVTGATFPGEALTRTALPVRTLMERKTPHTMLFGLTQDTLGYLVPSDEWRTGRNGNYEELVSVDQFIGDGIRDRLLTALGDVSFAELPEVDREDELVGRPVADSEDEDEELPSEMFRRELSPEARELVMVLEHMSPERVLETLRFLAAQPQGELAEVSRQFLNLQQHVHAH